MLLSLEECLKDTNTAYLSVVLLVFPAAFGVPSSNPSILIPCTFINLFMYHNHVPTSPDILL